MAEGEKGAVGSITSNSLIIAVLLAAGATFITRDAPLENARPAADEHVYKSYPAAGVEARLWQDPFSAIADDVAARSPPKVTRHQRLSPCHKTAVHPEGGFLIGAEEKFAEDFVNYGGEGKTLVLPVMVTGGSYEEDIELRRRVRYTVLAGLNVRDFRPKDSEHLNYYLAYASDNSPPKLLTAVPYEWFARNEPATSPPKFPPSPYKNVLVIWVNETLLNASDTHQPVARLNQLLRPIASYSAHMASGKCVSNFSMKILGPQTSLTYSAIADEVASLEKQFLVSEKSPLTTTALSEKTKCLAAENGGIKTFKIAETPAQFFTHSATLENEPKLPDGQIRPIAFRLTADDGKLAKALKSELQKRGVDFCSDHVAFVTEWDTPYGKNIVESMRSTFFGKRGECQNSKTVRVQETIIQYP